MHGHLPAGGGQHAGNTLQQRALPRAVGTDHREPLPAVQRKADVPQSEAGFVAHAQPFHFQGGHIVLMRLTLLAQMLGSFMQFSEEGHMVDALENRS